MAKERDRILCVGIISFVLNLIAFIALLVATVSSKWISIEVFNEKVEVGIWRVCKIDYNFIPALTECEYTRPVGAKEVKGMG